MSMHWSQLFVGALTLLGFISSSVKALRDKNVPPGGVTLYLFAYAGLTLLYVYALHVGGFW